MTFPPALARDRVEEASRALIAHVEPVPLVAVVLGSGLGEFGSRLEERVSIGYSAIPHWPAVSVDGHAGELLVGRIGAKRVMLLSGRAHLYEGHSAATIAFPIRVLARAGVRTIVLTNSAGGIDPALGIGTLMLIDDHINWTGTNPLVGSNDESIGPRFPDMSEVYSARLRRVADRAADRAGIRLAHGVYLGLVGPSYETPAEIRAFRALGASAVGMSTVLEAVTARHAGLEVLGLSCIANAASGLSGLPLRHEDVVAVARQARSDFERLMEGIIGEL